MNDSVSTRVTHLWNNLVWRDQEVVGQMGVCGVIGETATWDRMVTCMDCKRIMGNGGKHAEVVFHAEAVFQATPPEDNDIPEVVAWVEQQSEKATNVFEQPKQNPTLGHSHDRCNLRIKKCDNVFFEHTPHDWGMRGEVYHCEGVTE